MHFLLGCDLLFPAREAEVLSSRGPKNFDCACCNATKEPDVVKKSDDNRRGLKQIAIDLRQRVGAESSLYGAGDW